MLRVAVALLPLLVGCAVAPSQPPVSRAQYEDAMRAMYACGNENVAALDDGRSDAATIAFALSTRCAREYADATEKFGRVNLQNDAQRRMFRDKRNTREARTETFLSTVLEYRRK